MFPFGFATFLLSKLFITPLVEQAQAQRRLGEAMKGTDWSQGYSLFALKQLVQKYLCKNEMQCVEDSFELVVYQQGSYSQPVRQISLTNAPNGLSCTVTIANNVFSLVRSCYISSDSPSSYVFWQLDKLLGIYRHERTRAWLDE